jgi:hypothetical protein
VADAERIVFTWDMTELRQLVERAERATKRLAGTCQEPAHSYPCVSMDMYAAVLKERDELRAQRDSLRTRVAELAQERDQLCGQRETARLERDTLRLRVNDLTADLSYARHERDKARQARTCTN